MNRSIPKAHTISLESSPWTWALPTLLVLVVLVCIVLLGILGGGDGERDVHARDRPGKTATQELGSVAGDDG